MFHRSAHETSLELPQIAGNIHRGDAALEFIKHVCGVFSIDQNVVHDVLVLSALLNHMPCSLNHICTKLDALIIGKLYLHPLSICTPFH